MVGVFVLGGAWEHPRARGENPGMSPKSLIICGTSPRTRGKLLTCIFVVVCGRNIPAHAGKTISNVHSKHSKAEHPRARGENCKATYQHGSPAWNIPAHAGKTR